MTHDFPTHSKLLYYCIVIHFNISSEISGRIIMKETALFGVILVLLSASS